MVQRHLVCSNCSSCSSKVPGTQVKTLLDRCSPPKLKEVSFNTLLLRRSNTKLITSRVHDYTTKWRSSPKPVAEETAGILTRQFPPSHGLAPTSISTSGSSTRTTLRAPAVIISSLIGKSPNARTTTIGVAAQANRQGSSTKLSRARARVLDRIRVLDQIRIFSKILSLTSAT